MKGPLKFLGAGLFKGTAFIVAIVAIAAIWTYDASFLVAGEDMNLRLIKEVTAWLPEGYGSKTEAALRLFGADKAFLFTEVIAAVKLLMLAVGLPFRFRSNPNKRRAEMNFTRYNSHIYGLMVALGVPLMGWLVTDLYTKLVIACVWFAIVPILYFYLEGSEINGQIRKHGLLDQGLSDEQRKTMYFLYYGVIAAFVAWLLFLVAYISSNWSQAVGVWPKIVFMFDSIFNAPIHYGALEWGILVHTIVVARLAINTFFPLISNFLQATAGQKRYETETGRMPPAPHA